MRLSNLSFFRFLLLSSLIIFITSFSFILNNVDKEEASSVSQESVEITQIKNTTDIKLQASLYKQLIEKVGPVEAQEKLFASGLPFDGQTHLLNHTVGDWLFDRYGDEGLVYCKDYFLSSCYHGFVIRAIAKGGVSSLEKVMETCWKQGYPTATQCAHAIGHGLLAYDGYKNLTQALVECDKVSTISGNFPLYNCHDGVFMENIWAVHTGSPSKDQWVSETDNLYPCNSTKIPEKYKKACWSNQPSRMYMMFKGDIRKIGKVCLTVSNKDYQSTCFDALSRQIHPLTAGSVDKTFYYCSLLPADWLNSCISSIAKAAFSVGDRSTPFEICARAREKDKNMCYNNLIGIIKGYSQNQELKISWCKLIKDDNWKNNCLKF